MHRRPLMIGLALLPALPPAGAAELAGVKLDDRIALGGQELVLNGAGIRTRFMFKVYVCALYLPAKAGDLAGVLAKAPRRVQMTMLRDLGAEDLVGALVDGLKLNSTTDELAALKPQTEQLVTVMKSVGEVRSGGVVTMDFDGNETRIGYDGTAKGSIAGAPFNAALMKIWLGDKPAQADLKQAMLGR